MFFSFKEEMDLLRCTHFTWLLTVCVSYEKTGTVLGNQKVNSIKISLLCCVVKRGVTTLIRLINEFLKLGSVEFSKF